MGGFRWCILFLLGVASCRFAVVVCSESMLVFVCVGIWCVVYSADRFYIV